jgi:hypothetical protein
VGSFDIRVIVDKGSILGDLVNDQGDDVRLRVDKQAGCCKLCVANDNPYVVPPFGEGVHIRCRCRAVIEEYSE